MKYLFVLTLLLAGCFHPQYFADLGKDDGYNYFRCLGRCHGQNMYDVRMSKDFRYCACRNNNYSDAYSE